MITTRTFGKTKDGREVLAFTLEDGACRLTVLNYGGTVQSLIVPDKDGKPTDVVLGYPDMRGYEENGGYLGALIGRFGNRIGEGKLTIDGVTYDLFLNDRGNHLHGGRTGFDKKIWAHAIEGDALVLTLLSPDGEENYPGNLTVRVVYTLRGGEMRIAYRATTDKKTALNLTNHAYFNLNGEGRGDVLGHILWIDSDEMLPTNPTMIPVGGVRSVEGTPFDFRTPKEIGKDIGADDVDLRQGNGYDHCYLLKNTDRSFIEYARVTSPLTGITMHCYTDIPSVQLYTGNGLKQEGKSGYYGKRTALCLETQAIPNNVNVPEYAARFSSFLDAGEVYETVSAYRFTA